MLTLCFLCYIHSSCSLSLPPQFDSELLLSSVIGEEPWQWPWVPPRVMLSIHTIILEAHLSTGSHLQILLIVRWSAFLTMSPWCQLCDMGTLCHCYDYSWPSPGLVEPIWGWVLILEPAVCQAQPRGQWRYCVSSPETIGSFPPGSRIISRSRIVL